MGCSLIKGTCGMRGDEIHHTSAAHVTIRHNIANIAIQLKASPTVFGGVRGCRRMTAPVLLHSSVPRSSCISAMSMRPQRASASTTAFSAARSTATRASASIALNASTCHPTPPVAQTSTYRPLRETIPALQEHTATHHRSVHQAKGNRVSGRRNSQRLRGGRDG